MIWLISMLPRWDIHYHLFIFAFLKGAFRILRSPFFFEESVQVIFLTSDRKDGHTSDLLQIEDIVVIAGVGHSNCE